MILNDEDKDSVKIPSWWFGGCTRMKNTCVATEMECPQLKKLDSKGIFMKESIQQYIDHIEQEHDDRYTMMQNNRLSLAFHSPKKCELFLISKSKKTQSAYTCLKNSRRMPMLMIGSSPITRTD